MPLYPLGISRSRDVASVPKQAAGTTACALELMRPSWRAFSSTHRIKPFRRCFMLPYWMRSIAESACCRCDSGLRCGRRSKSTLCCKIVARNCSTNSAALMRLAKWDCESHCQVRQRPQVAVSSGSQSPLDYIEGRRSYYQRADEDAECERLMVQQFVDRLHGCYRQWRRLPSSASRRSGWHSSSNETAWRPFRAARRISARRLKKSDARS